jgi:hypothetical protein
VQAEAVTVYYYRVRATNALGESANSNTPYVYTLPAAPSNAAATFVSATRIDVNWTDNSSLEWYYYVEQSPNGSTGWSLVGSAGANSTSFSASGPLNPSTTYYFRVRAYGNYAYSGYSNTVPISTPSFPLAPSNLIATAVSDTQVDLTWTDNSNNETGFVIERSPNGSNTWTQVGDVGPDTSTFSDTTAPDGSRSYYRVYAYNGNGNSNLSPVANAATIPAAPTSLAGTAVGPTQIDLTWTDNSSHETGYRIEQSPDGTTGWTEVGTTAANIATFSASGPFEPSMTYFFRVRASGNQSNSSYSNTANVSTPAIPLVPANLTATAVSDTEIDLQWDDDSNTSATGYRIERMTNSASWALLENVTGSHTVTHDDTALNEGTAYYYRVRGTVNSFQSDYSSVVYTITPPAAPTGMAATFAGAEQVDLSWQDHSSVEVGYAIDQLLPDGVTWQQVKTVSPGTGTLSTSVVGAFSPSTVYSFRVRAYVTDFSGSPLYSIPSSDIETSGVWPAAPTNLVATAASNTQIDLSWADTTGETGYEIERSADGVTGWTQIGTAAADATSYDDTAVTDGERTLHYYRVRATHSGTGNSPYTNVSMATTLLAQPTGLTADLTDGDHVSLGWVDHSVIEDGYSIEQLMPDGITWEQIQTTDAGAGTGSMSATVAGTFASATYYFRVSAYLDVSVPEGVATYVYSQVSSEATATALAWPAAPTNLTTTAISNTQIDLSWTNNASNATAYQIERTIDGETWTVVTSTLAASAVSYQDTGLTDGTLYAYRVRALNALGGSAYAMNEAVTLPTAPTNLQAVAVSGTQIDLSWTASQYATGYTIWSIDQDSASWTLVDDSVPSSQTSYSVTGLQPGGTAYAFRVAPTNSTSDLAASYTDTLTQNQSPSITSASAGESTVTTTSTTVSVSASDDQSESYLTYSWSIVSSPSEYDAEFDDTDTNDAKETSVTFYEAGSYVFLVTVTDALGASATSTVSVSVEQTLTSVEVTPGAAGMLQGQTRQFTATGRDQFRDEMTTQPTFGWSVDGVGNISSSGLYTAPASGDETASSITVSATGLEATADIAISRDGAVYVQATDVNLVKVFTTDGTFIDTLPFNGPFPEGLSFRGAQNLYLADGSYLDASQPLLVRRDAGGSVIQTYISGHAPPWTGMVLDPNGTSFWACDYSCYVYKFDIATGALELEFWGSGSLAQMGILADPALLELTVSEYFTPTTNSVTVIDTGIQELYVAEDPQTHTAQIDISTLAAGSGASQQIRLRVERSDGYVLVDDYLDSLTQTLAVTELARDFTVVAWVDSDGDFVADAGEEPMEVEVHVVEPWKRVDEWTMTSGYVEAQVDGADLQQLANDIVGHDVPIARPRVIRRGDRISVKTLLRTLEKDLRTNVKNAALAPKFAHFPDHSMGERGDYGEGLKEADVNAIFTAGDAIQECYGMTALVMARGLITTLKPGEFDKIWGNTDVINVNDPTTILKKTTIPILGSTKIGDWLYFRNDPDYLDEHINGGYQGENVIRVTSTEYWGWTGSNRVLPYGNRANPRRPANSCWTQILFDEYNAFPVPESEYIDRIPGYMGTAKFFNVALVGMNVFDFRTSD